MRSIPTKSHRQDGSSQRTAFTLVELLVVVAITLIVTAMTVTAVNFSITADRVRASARQIQSLIAGARDRAIYAKDVRGIRLIRDPNDNHSVNAFQYVGAPSRISIGTLSIPNDINRQAAATFPPTIPNDGSRMYGNGTIFLTLKNQGLIRIGSRIQIPSGTGRWYTIAGVTTSFTGAEEIILSQPYADFVNTSTVGMNFGRNYEGLSYLLELQAQPLPDSAPVQLPRGAVIDLDGSLVPPNWNVTQSFLGAYSNQMDILFSAKGLPVGDVANFGLGKIHLHVADAGDVVRWKTIGGRSPAAYTPPTTPVIPAENPKVVTRDHILVSMATRTGNVAVYPVNITTTFTNAAGALVLSDPYLYAETGAVAAQ